MTMYSVALVIMACTHYIVADAQGYTASVSQSFITSQHEAMKQFYLSTRMYSESSMLLHNWMFDNKTSSGEYCNFTGVTCDRNYMVTTIELNNTKLSGSLPDAFGGLSNLRRLRLFNNSIKGTIPVSLIQLPTLQVLNLGQNLLSGILPEFPSSKMFTRLSLRRNAIFGTIPHSICNLTNLVVLEMSELTRMRGSIPQCFGTLTALTALRVSDIGLTGTVPTNLCGAREMNGLMPNTFGCDAIACPVGTFQRSVGRQSNEDTPCIRCSVPSNVIGTRTCQWHEVNVPSLSPSSNPPEVPTLSPSVKPSEIPSLSPLVTPSEATSSPTPKITSYPEANNVPSVQPTLLPLTSEYPFTRTNRPALSRTSFPSVDINQSSRNKVFAHPGYATGIALLCIVLITCIFVLVRQHRPLLPSHKRLTDETSSHPGSSLQESSVEADFPFNYPQKVEVKKPESKEFDVGDDISLNFNDIYFTPFDSARGLGINSLQMEKPTKSNGMQSTPMTKENIPVSNEAVLGAARKVRFNIPSPMLTSAEAPTAVDSPTASDHASIGREDWLSWLLNPLFDPIATCGTPCRDISKSDVEIASAISLDSAYSNLSSLFVANGAVSSGHLHRNVSIPPSVIDSHREVSSVLGIRDIHSMNDDSSINSLDGSVKGNSGAIFRQNLESRLRARATWNSIHHDFGKQSFKSGECTGEV